MSDQVTRRAFLAAAGTAGAAWLAADPELVHAALSHARRTVAAAPPYRFAVLTPAQAAGLEAVAMRILPSDGTPGAKEAGVIHFIDQALASFARDQQEPLLAGLDDLNARTKAQWPEVAAFAALAPERQDELLRAIEKTPFFATMRAGTVMGMFSNPSYGGNRDQVGWKLLGFQAHGIYQPPFGYYDAEAQRGS